MGSKSVGTNQPGILHHYTNGLVTFEHTLAANATKKPNSLLFIGGLGDGLFTVPFITDLVAALEPTDWSVFSILLSSSYTRWGLGRLGRDVEEIGQCVDYIRKYKQSQVTDQSSPKVVIMGHSTGSQDVLHYIYSPNPLPADVVFNAGLHHIIRPEVDGAIVQAPVSDRETVVDWRKNGGNNLSAAEFETIFLQLVDMAKRMTYTDGNELDFLLPLSLTSKIGYPPDAPISARRFLSLTSPDSPENPQENDLFSSDLTDKRLEETFGMIATRDVLRSKILVLYSGNDQYTPKWVDKEQLLRRWKAATDKPSRIVWDERSGIISGATHTLVGENEADARRDLAMRVTHYLNDLKELSSKM